MGDKPITGEKRVFMTGNEVAAWGALAANAEIMYGYPITPQNEIMHYWTRLAPKHNRHFLQTEDELSAGFTTIGGVLTGKKAFTATAGPGNILMQEPMSMAEAMRLPTVTLIIQRGGPSTGTVIYSQQEVMMTVFGGNGEGLRIVYSVANHQELFDYTIKAFDTAWKYRFPTFVLADGYQGKMREPLTIYDPAERGIQPADTEAFVGLPGKPGVDRPPGHYRNTYNIEEELYDVLQEYIKDFDAIADDVCEKDMMAVDDAELVIVAHGVVARAAKQATEILREQGLKVGYFRPVTLRPFPTKPLREVARTTGKMLVVESAQGQLGRIVKENLYGETSEIFSHYKPGVGITPEEITARCQELLK